MDVGLIGLGGMGTGIAKSLLRGGHRVTVFNRTRARAEALQTDGAIVAATVSDACRAGIVMTMVADDAALESQVFSDGGILASLPRGRSLSRVPFLVALTLPKPGASRWSPRGRLKRWSAASLCSNRSARNCLSSAKNHHSRM